MSGDILYLIKSDLRVNNSSRSGFFGILLALFFDPGFCVAIKIRLMIYFRNRVGFLSKLFWMSLVRRGVYVSPDAKIGAGLFLPHPVAIVIGSGSVIGDFVTIYQCVTIGRRDVSLDEYPIIGSGCVLCAGSIIIGGVILCENITVGANSVVNRSFSDCLVVAGVPARIIN